MKSIFLITAISIASFANCQTNAITLSDAATIDHHVVDVEWQPDGHALIYKREQEKGFGLGVYEPGKFEGKVVVQLAKEEVYETNWLADSNAALLVIRGPGAKAKTTAVRIVLIEGDTQSAKQLFADTYDEELVPNIDVNASPGLKHAIIEFRSNSGVLHKVLTVGGGNFADAPDLDRAVKEGMKGPSWSLDGTAIYGPAASYGNGAKDEKAAVQGQLLGEKFAIDQQTAQALGAVVTERLAVKTVEAADINLKLAVMDAKYARMRFRRFNPSPNVGTDVFELMPANPMLRPVRFRGAWMYPSKKVRMVVSKSQSIVLKYDQSNAQDNSVWLTQGNQKGAQATLVAVHVTDSWLSSTKNGVAYTIDGALFCREVK